MMRMMRLVFFLYRDSSIAPLLDMRRRFKAVVNVLDSMISHGVTLARSVELTAQWSRILSIGPLYLSRWMIFMQLKVLVVVIFIVLFSDVHHRLSDFIHFWYCLFTVGMWLIRRWRSWVKRGSFGAPKKSGFVQNWFPGSISPV